MCINFVKKQGDGDFFSPLINFIGNGLTLAAAGAALTVVTTAALRALGYNKQATRIVAAIPFAVGLIGLGIAATGLAALAAIICAIASAFSRR